MNCGLAFATEPGAIQRSERLWRHVLPRCCEKAKRERRSTLPFCYCLKLDQVQVMTSGAVTPKSHVFADRLWIAVAVHAGGGPATDVAVTVTFAEAAKPWAAPSPEKYEPWLSAAYCS